MSDQTSRDVILQNATRLLSFTTQICQERGRLNLISVFKDDIIRLTCEQQKFSSLLRLYTSFKDFEPRVLIQLNDFLPVDLRYVVQMVPNDAQTPTIKIDLAPKVAAHTNQQSSVQPLSNDQQDIFIKALEEMTSQQNSTEFKALLTRFVSGTDSKLEVLQFMIKSNQLLANAPELIAGLLQYLNKSWQSYIIEQFKIKPLPQLAIAYGVFQENITPAELLQRVLTSVQNDLLTEEQKRWRESLIKEVMTATSQMAVMCQHFDSEAPKKRAKPIQQPQQRYQNNMAFQSSISASQQREIERDKTSMLATLRDVVNDGYGENLPLEAMQEKMHQFFKGIDQHQILLDFQVPCNRDLVLQVLTLLKQDHAEVQHFSSIAECAIGSPSVMWQDGAVNLLINCIEASTVGYLELDDPIELSKALKFGEILEIFNSNQLLRRSSYQHQKDVLIQLCNQIFVEPHRIMIFNQIISTRQLCEDVMFYNAHASDCYGSQQYNAISFLDSKKRILELEFTDLNGNPVLVMQPPPFTSFEQKIMNLSVPQRLSLVKQRHKLDQITSFDIDAQLGFNNSIMKDKKFNQVDTSYRFINPLRFPVQDKSSVINRNYCACFHNGCEFATANSVNPYNLQHLEQDIERLFDEIEDSNQLEEHLMKYDIFINNLKYTQAILYQFCKDVCPNLYQRVIEEESVVPKELEKQNLNPFNYKENSSRHPEPSQRESLGYRELCRLDKTQCTGSRFLQLPSNCQQLLKPLISEEYFNTILLYPAIAAPYVLKRLQTILADMEHSRHLLVSPAYSKRLREIYFGSLDYSGKFQLESEKKLSSGKCFLQELNQKRQTANIIDLKNDDSLNNDKVAYPWDFDSFGLPNVYQKQIAISAISNRTPRSRFDAIKQILAKCQAPGCACLVHGPPPPDQGLPQEEQIKQEDVPIDPTVRVFNTEQTERFNNCLGIFNRYLSSAPQLKNNQQIHYCSYVPHIMIPFSQIKDQAIGFIKDQILFRDELRACVGGKEELFDKILQVVMSYHTLDDREKKVMNITLIDQNIYNFVRYMLVWFDRFTYLYNLSQKHDCTINVKSEILEFLKENNQINPETAHQQQLVTRHIFQDIDDLSQVGKMDSGISAEMDDWEIMLMLLQSTRQGAEQDLIALYGSQVFIGFQFKNTIKQLRKLFDDIWEGLGKYRQLSGSMSVNMAAMSNATVITGFLLELQLYQDIGVVLKEGLTYYVANENFFKNVYAAYGSQIVLMEVVDSFLCFSELDFYF